MSANKPTQVEDGLRFNDVNKRLVIRSIGFGPRGTTSTLEQMLTPITMPALLVNGDLLMSGNAQHRRRSGQRAREQQPRDRRQCQ